jgi:uncharacterized protein involved in copper resistance
MRRPLQEAFWFRAEICCLQNEPTLAIRADVDFRPARVWAAVCVEGLAPYFFDFEPTFYVRDGGLIAGRINGS